MMNSTTENLPFEMQNAVHNATDQSQIDSSDHTLTVSEFTAQLNTNASESLLKSDSSKETPDNKGWYLYRPRTRSAKKKILFREVTVISSDSEGSDVECIHNPFVMKMAPKKELVSEVSSLEETASCVEVLFAVNTNPVKMSEDPHSNNDDNMRDVTDSIDETKRNIKTEVATKKEGISDDLPLEEAVDSHVVATDDSKLLDQEATAYDSCVEVRQPSESPVEVLEQQTTETSCVESNQPSVSPAKVLSDANTNTLLVETRQDPHSSCSNDNDSNAQFTDRNNCQASVALINEGEDNENGNSPAVKGDSDDMVPTEAVIDGLYNLKGNIVSSESSAGCGFTQNIESSSVTNQSPELLVYGIGQTKRKDISFECSSCSKCDNAISSGTSKTDSSIQRVSQLKPKCLQFESESHLHDSIIVVNAAKRSLTPDEILADTTRNLEDSPIQRLEWSSDPDDCDADGETDSDESTLEWENRERVNDLKTCKNKCVEDSTGIDETNGNFDDTEKAKVLNSSDDKLMDELSQQTTNRSYLGNRSLSDDELVTSGRYGQQVANFVINLSDSAVAQMHSMGESVLRENDVPPAPVLQNQDMPPVNDRTPAPSVSSKSQDDDKSVKQSNNENIGSEHEYGQRPLENDGKLLIPPKHRLPADNSMNLAEIPEKRRKRSHVETSTHCDSNAGKQIQTDNRKPKRSSLKLWIGGFFLKVAENLRDKRKKLKAKLSRKRKRLSKRQGTTAGSFIVTPYRTDEAVESMKGFVIVPDRHQDSEDEDDK